MSKKLIGNLLTLLTTLLSIFVIGEITARIYLSGTDDTNQELKIYDPHEKLGWVFLAGKTAEHGPGKPVPKIEINSLGLRDDETTVEKPAGKKRILMLGDSFTFGFLVDQKKNFPYFLEKKLDQEVLNFGVIGYTLDQEYLLLREKGLSFKPDVVIVNVFSGNDATEFRIHDLAYDKNGKLEKVKDRLHFITEEHELRRKRFDNLPRSYFITFLTGRVGILLQQLRFPVNNPRLLWSNYLPKDHPWGDPKIDEYFELVKKFLREIKKLNDANGIKTLITIIPSDFEVADHYQSKYPSFLFSEGKLDLDHPREEILDLAAEMPIYDLIEDFKKYDSEKNPLYFKEKDSHFTPRGHEVMAELLQKYLTKMN